jgi:thiol-disulfide isomerase/thioredoxin
MPAIARAWSRVGPRCAAAVLSFGFVAGCTASHPTASPAAASAAEVAGVVGVTTYASGTRQAAPALAGTTLDGTSLSLSAAGRGKVVVLNIWASWCGPCREESPMLAGAARSFAAKPVQFVGVDEQDRQAPARAFAASTGMSYPHLVDESGGLLRKLKMLPQMGIPSTLVLDRSGRIAARVIGPITLQQVTHVVDGLLAES